MSAHPGEAAPATAARDKDWLVEMFLALRDCGEDIGIVFGQPRPAADGDAAPPAGIHWQLMPHDRYDGISGLEALLVQQGLPVPALPVMREAAPSRLRIVKGFASVLRYLGVRRQAWTVDFGWERPVAFLPAGERVAWTVFDPAQTHAMVQAAKAAGVTVNTWLLRHLDDAVRARWVPDGAHTRWMLPVNVRGAIARAAHAPPLMTFLPVDPGQAATFPALQAQVQDRMRQGQHWGMWSLLQLGRLLGEDGLRKDIRKREGQRHGVTGMFSNLGTWAVAGGGPWVFCPAITRVYPIGAGCVTVNGRMALALQLHDALGATLAQTRDTFDAWTAACLAAAGVAAAGEGGITDDAGTAPASTHAPATA